MLVFVLSVLKVLLVSQIETVGPVGRPVVYWRWDLITHK